MRGGGRGGRGRGRGGGSGGGGSSSTNDQDEMGKMFVGGLSWETTQDALHQHFSRFGEVIDCVVMKNPETGRSRGFGFVTFSDPKNVDLVLDSGPQELDGRTIDPKPCNPRGQQSKMRQKAANFPKIFLGGLPSNLTETDLRNFFTRYGKVQEVVIMFDQEKKKSRGFGFLSFESDESVERCVAEHFVSVNGKQVEIKRAEPRESKDGGGGGGMFGGGDGPGWGGPSDSWGMGGPSMAMGPGGPSMGGPTSQMGPMGTGMMQGYQSSWGGPAQTQGYGPQAGFGGPSAPQSYQGWGTPGTQQMGPQQWSSYSQGSYGSYGTAGNPQSGYTGNWNWNMSQNGSGPPQSGPTQTSGGPPTGQGESWTVSQNGLGPQQGAANQSSSGPQTTAGPYSSVMGGQPGPMSQGGTPGTVPPAPKSDYSNWNQYGSMGNYPQEASSYGPARGYGDQTALFTGQPPPVQPQTPQAAGGGQGYAPSTPPYGAQGNVSVTSYPPAPAGPGGSVSGGPGGPGGPGPQRGSGYSQPSQAQGYHPYRRM